MNDYQPAVPPESDDESSAPRGRRGISAWLWGCLALTILLVVAVAVILLTVLKPDDGDRTAALVGRDSVTLSEPESEQSAPSPTKERAQPESEGEQPLPETTPSLQPGNLGSQNPTETAEPAATEPPPTPTTEPTAKPAPTSTTAAGEPFNAAAGRIAIVDRRGRLWTVAPDGSDRRLLSESGRFYQFPSWSPAGNHIAVIGNSFDSSGVYIVADEEDSQLRQLYSDPVSLPIYLYWSPDGANVSFIANHPDGLALHLVSRDGTIEPELVATSPSTFFWDWMPDSSQVLVHTGFTARDTDDSRLAFIPLDSAHESEEIVQSGFFQAPAVASDGRFYSFSDQDPAGRRWLSVWDIDRNQPAGLVFHQGVVAMGFSPTNAQLAYTSPERPAQSFYGPLRLLDLESGDPRLLSPETVLAFFWSPDGRSIAYLTLSDIEGPLDFDDAPVARIDGTLSAAVAALAAPDKSATLAKAQPTPEPESRIGLGLSVVDVDSGQSRRLAVFEPSDIFLSQFLPFFDQYALSHQIWSPDSQALVVPMKDENSRDFIVVVPADGSQPAAVAPGVAAFWSR